MTTPHPGSRLDMTQRATAAAAPGPEAYHEAPPEPAMVAIPVTLKGQAPALNGRYRTVTIPASTAAVVSYAQLLPYDECRQVAYIMPIDSAIIVATSREQAQDPANIGGTFPTSGYQSQPLTVQHREAVWAANPSTTGSVRVSVAVETGEGQ